MDICLRPEKMPTTSKAFDDWLEEGRIIASTKTSLDWAIADWVSYGQQAFPEQIEIALGSAVGDLVGDRRAIEKMAKTALAFPPSVRSSKLSFEHHAQIADMPRAEALPFLVEAERQHWTARRLRLEAVMANMDIAQCTTAEGAKASEIAVSPALVLALLEEVGRSRSLSREESELMERIVDRNHQSELRNVNWTPALDAELAIAKEMKGGIRQFALSHDMTPQAAYGRLNKIRKRS